SPFRVIADYPYEPSRVVVTGLQSEAYVGCPVLFDIDASRTREAPIAVTVPPIYQQPLLEKDIALPRLYHARFTPVGEPGCLVPVDITYDGKALPSSPFLIKLLPEVDVNMMTVSGLDGSTRFLDVCASREVAARIDVSKCGNVTDLKVLVLVRIFILK
uniref:Cadherin domain-containing protein n=1 Tax=Angiostrongylus cantonensis TaxID=6313 RepID=A0A0K0D7W9_ANGCA